MKFVIKEKITKVVQEEEAIDFNRYNVFHPDFNRAMENSRGDYVKLKALGKILNKVLFSEVSTILDQEVARLYEGKATDNKTRREEFHSL